MPGGSGTCSGIGKDCALQVYGAQMNVDGVYTSDIADASGTRLRNYTGDLATAFSQIALRVVPCCIKVR